MKWLPRSTPAVVTGLALLMILTTTGGAVAGGLITGKKIKDGTITSADIKNGTILKKDLAASAQAVQGKPGKTGPAGVKGATGPRGFAAWDTIPSGTTVTGEVYHDGATTGASGTDHFLVNLPGVLPQDLNDSTVNFKTSAGLVGDGDATCSGTAYVPTAPAGKVCLYLIEKGGMDLPFGYPGALRDRAFQITWSPTGGAPQDMYLHFTWAYTAP